MQTKGDVFTVREGGYLMEGCPSQENLQCSDSLVPRLSPGRAFRTTSNKSWAEARVMRFMCVYKHCYFPCRLQYEACESVREGEGGRETPPHNCVILKTYILAHRDSFQFVPCNSLAR